jgi:myosin heavy subunit
MNEYRILRYKTHKEIYSIYGNILVSINPFCETKLYSNDYIRIYNGCIKDRTSETKEPHLFKTCAKVLNNLIE